MQIDEISDCPEVPYSMAAGLAAEIDEPLGFNRPLVRVENQAGKPGRIRPETMCSDP
jgi:hypothetical protein